MRTIFDDINDMRHVSDDMFTHLFVYGSENAHGVYCLDKIMTTNIAVGQKVWVNGEEDIVKTIIRPLGTFEMFRIELLSNGAIVEKAFHQMELVPPDVMESMFDFKSCDGECLPASESVIHKDLDQTNVPFSTTSST